MRIFKKFNINFPKKINFNFFKKIKKNEFLIYAIALMLVTAGYFNYTANLEDTTLQTYAEGSEELLDDYANVGDARLVDSNDVIENTSSQENSSETSKEQDNKEQNEDSNKEIAKAEEQKEQNESEENIETDEKAEDDNESTTETIATESNENDYFVSSKLDRDKSYASMISTYTSIVEDSNVSETERAIAMKEITKINDTKNAISICENLISTKGFTNCIILVNNDSVNVVVELREKLTADKVAQIQNIVSREFDCKIENIHITER